MTDRQFSGNVIFDARCLQDSAYANRGIGRHTVNILRHAPQRDDRVILGIIDPLMAQLTPEIAGLFDAVYPNAQVSAFRNPACFVSPSPMTHDPLFVARLLHDPRPLKVAVVHDLTPYESVEQQRFTSKASFDYYVCLKWLSSYDLFLPISDTSVKPLRNLLGIADGQIGVSAHTIDLIFEMTSTRPPGNSHILVIGGNESSKNTECAIRAHATSVHVKSRRIPLVMTGDYSREQALVFSRMSIDLGGDPALLIMPGQVSEAAFAELCADAICLIVPSHTNGFDLPSLKGLVAGAPVLTSYIPARREFSDDAAWRFEPDDYIQLSDLIDRIISNPLERARLLAIQTKASLPFRANLSAARFWKSIDARVAVAAAPAVLRGIHPRVALVSSLPPAIPGGVDYIASMCAELGRVTELHTFSQSVTSNRMKNQTKIWPMTAFPSVSSDFDRVINIMGKSPKNLSIFEKIMRYGGACIAYDVRMLNFYACAMPFSRTASIASVELQRLVSPEEVKRWIVDESLSDASFLSEIMEAADPLMIHSNKYAADIERISKKKPVVLPFPIKNLYEQNDRNNMKSIRLSLNISCSEIVILSFYRSGKKNTLLQCLWVIDFLRGWHVAASLYIVGDRVVDADFTDLVNSLGLKDKVQLVEAEIGGALYFSYIIAADLGLVLRVDSLGEVSDDLVNCVSARLPTVANASLVDAIGQPAYVRPVQDAVSPILVAEALVSLLDDGLVFDSSLEEQNNFFETRSINNYCKRVCEALDMDVYL